MKLATFSIGGKVTWGLVSDGVVLDCGFVLRAKYPTLKSLIAADGYAEVTAACDSAKSYPIATIDWLPVVPDPAKILCIGLNYEMPGRSSYFARLGDGPCSRLCLLQRCERA
jgi:hypothetical protein